MKYGELTKCFTNNHSATISYRSEGHTNVIVNHAKRALSFLKRALFLIILKVGGTCLPPPPHPTPLVVNLVIQLVFCTTFFYPKLTMVSIAARLDRAVIGLPLHIRPSFCRVPSNGTRRRGQMKMRVDES